MKGAAESRDFRAPSRAGADPFGSAVASQVTGNAHPSTVRYPAR
jgi:hypothetical protein